MVTGTFVNIDLKEASRLSDLTGISADLSDAQELANELKKLLADADWNRWNVEALTIAILVKYSRPFSNGIRDKLEIDKLPALSEEQREKHRHLMAFRNKHIAHSVNSYENNQPIARYVEGREDTEGVYEISCQHGRVVGLSSNEIKEVLELTAAILSYVDNELKKEKKALLGIVRKIPIKELLSKEKALIVPGKNSNITKPRKKQ